MIYARFSDSVRGFDREMMAFTGVPGAIRDYETNLEFSYQAQIVPGWTVQPDLNSSGIQTAMRARTQSWSARAGAVAILRVR